MSRSGTIGVSVLSLGVVGAAVSAFVLSHEAASAIGVVFSLALASALVRGRRAACGCFGRKRAREIHGRCPPDTPDCGGNDCSAMPEAAKRTMECFQRTVDATADELQTPWGPRAEPVVDPSPHEPGPVGIPCFDALFEPDAAPAGRAAQGCWAVDCGPDFDTVSGPAGCKCQPRDAGPAGEGLQGNCTGLDCSQGRAVFRNGHCECSDEQSVGVLAGDFDGGGLPGPVGSFAVGQPTRFSETQEGHFGPDWPRV